MNIPKEVEDQLIDEARRAMELAYAPYSEIRVGAAFLTQDRKIFNGCNVENSSYGLTSCAERNAIFKAISEGSKEFIAGAIVSDCNLVISPCGACRQVIAEFNPELPLVIVNPKGKIYMEGKDLLPGAFSLVHSQEKH